MPERDGAVLSDCKRYRYALSRDLRASRKLMGGPPLEREEETCLFVMLNPSTADAREDDPTIIRCRGFAQGWGFGFLAVANLYAFRATEPASLGSVGDRVGPDADEWIETLAASASLIVCAWGASEWVQPERALQVCLALDEFSLVAPMVCLQRTEDGHPSHPLYLAGDLEPQPFTWWRELYG